MIINSYSGYYNNMFLRSSYEYIFIKCLEKENIDFKYEEKTFNLSNGERYKPDFFIYKNNIFQQIIEIKSEKNEELEKAKRLSNLMKQDYNIEVQIIQQKEIQQKCKILNLDYNELEQQWKNNKTVSQKQDWSGERNPMYGLSQTDKCKEVNRKKQLEKFKTKESRQEFSKKMKIVMSNIDMKSVQAHRILPREKRKCLNNFCNNTFEVIITSKRKFCSRECALKSNERKIGEKQKLEKKNKQRQIMKEEVLLLALQNKDRILSIKMNNIEKPLLEIYNDLLKNYGLKDLRNLIFLFTGNYSSRKALVMALQNYIKSYHR